MSLWFRPACDTLLAKIQVWHDKYEKGEVYSTRDWLSPIGSVEKMPTRYLHRVPFHPVEFKHLIAIMKAGEAKNKLTVDLEKIWQSMQMRFSNVPFTSRPKWMASGEWLVPMAYYKADVKELVDALLRARDGRETLEDLMKSQKEQGKGLFEV
jgi:hypothetical protein